MRADDALADSSSLYRAVRNIRSYAVYRDRVHERLLLPTDDEVPRYGSLL